MIDYSDRSALGIIFSWMGSTLSRTYPEIITSAIITLLANILFYATEWRYDREKMGEYKYFDWLTDTGHTLLLLPVAFLLVFRTGMAYNRFMEGRGLVGKMVLSTRELARGLSTYVKGDDPQTQQNRANVARLVKAYTVALRLSLRKIESDEQAKAELAQFLTATEFAKIQAVKKNFVLIIIKWMGDALAQFKGQLLFDRAMDFMEKNVSDMMEAWMGMHKLATTQMPFPYVQMLYALLYLYMFTIGFPWALEYQWISIGAVLVLAYALFGINAIGQELEDPFGEEINDLDLPFFEGAANAACKVMLPAMLKPGVLEPNDTHAVGNGEHSTTKNPLAASSAPADVQTVLNDPGFEAKVKAECATATEFSGLSPELQVVFTQYFDRYDLNGNGILDNHKELTQLVTNLAFALKFGAGLSKLLEQVDAVEDGFSWDPAMFVAWFLKQAKLLM